jgi:signal transduction histidine kinase/CheY-like chemotaxis protein
MSAGAREEERDRGEIDDLRLRLRAAQDVLDAVRREVDAIVVHGPTGPDIFTVTNTDQPYRMIVEEMLQGAVVLTPDRDIYYCNRYFADIVRVPPEGIVGRPMSEFIAAPDAPAFAGLIGQGTGTLEAVLRATDGTELPVYITASLFGDAPASLCLVVTDLTEQKRQAVRDAMLAQEEAARAEAEAANQAKDQFLTILSHELRNPLGIILNGVEVLDRISSGEPGPVKTRAIIRRQAHHLGKLLDDLLDMTRVSQGKIELHRQPIDLADVVSTATEDHRSEIERAGIALSLSLPTEVVAVDGDRTRLLQALGNLLHNARKCTGPGGQISISLGQTGQLAEVRVRDTGIGIEPEMLERIFDLFWQRHPSPTPSVAGLGIGLTLVRRLVDLHDGSVEALSDGPGHGSEFVIRIPVTRAPVLNKSKVPAPEPLPSFRLLLIEDHEDARDMARHGLELLGQSVTAASDGETGIAMAVSDPPDAVFVDIGLPGLDGYEVGRRLREALGARVRLVALTGYGRADDRRRVREAGFDAHLVKPVVPTDMLKALRMLETKSPEDGLPS